MMIIKRRITKAYFNVGRRQYAPLIYRLSTRIGINTRQAEEMQCRANEELLKCMICYDGSGSFITFLHSRLAGVFRHIRDAERRANRVHTISPEHMANIAESDHDVNVHAIVEDLLECLNEEERNIITELFLNDKTMRDISNNLGGVASTVYRIKTKAIQKMRRMSGMILE